MSGKWFANRAQIIQTIAAVTSACVALVALYFVLKSNNSLPRLSAIMYVSAAISLLLIGILIGKRSQVTSAQNSSRDSGSGASTDASHTTMATGGSATATGGNVNVYMHQVESASPIPADEKEPIPLLELAQLERFTINRGSGILRVEDADAHVVTSKFRNPRLGLGRATPTAHRVHAQLTFRSSSHQQIVVHHGHWLEQYTHFAQLGPGEVQTLVVALSRGKEVYTLENRNSFDPRRARIRSGVTVLHAPHTVELPADTYTVEIALLSGEITLYEHRFLLAREPDGNVRLA